VKLATIRIGDGRERVAVVALDDLNGDGALAVAVANLNGESISVLLNERSGAGRSEA
jgi:hypothetical protein